MTAGVGFDSNRYQWRSEGSLGDPVYRCRAHILAVLALGGQDKHPVRNHPQSCLLGIFVHRETSRYRLIASHGFSSMLNVKLIMAENPGEGKMWASSGSVSTPVDEVAGPSKSPDPIFKGGDHVSPFRKGGLRGIYPRLNSDQYRLTT